MIRLSHLAAAASLGLVGFVGACTSNAPSGTHMHGPRGQPMQDSAMAAQRDQAQCPGGTGMHQMPGPHGGPMPDSAHGGCPPKQQQPNSDESAESSQPNQQ